MAESLNEFLELVDALDSDPYMTDEEFGYRVRVAWAEMKEAEKNETASTHSVIGPDGNPVTVTVPKG